MSQISCVASGQERKGVMFKNFVAGIAALTLTLLPLAGTVSAATLVNPITNPSVEIGTTTPTGWTGSSWTSVAGAITPTFEYVTGDGHGDSKSLKVTMANYEKTYIPGADDGTTGGAMTGDDGDAKWIFDPIATTTGTPTAAAPLQVGKQYRFNAWYKTNTTPKVVVDYMDAAGTESFYGMSNPQPTAASATTWTQYSNTFSVPQGASKVTIFMFLDQNGWVQTDDYSIEEYTPTGFSEPLVTLTFDDGHEDNATNALPLLNQYGFKTTQCFETTTLIANPVQAETNVKAFFNAGHEICSHTVTHPMLTQVSDAQLIKELTESKHYLENIIGQAVPNFASPYGDYNQHVNDVLKSVSTSYGGYTSHRTVDEGYNSKDNFDPYRLRVQNVFSTTTAAQISAWVAQAQADKTWLVLVYHRVVDTSKATDPTYEAPGPYDTSLDLFKTHLAAIQASGVKVSTMKDALAETEAQIGIVTPPVTTKTGDLNNDGVVDEIDLSTMLYNWNKTGMTKAQGDVSGDGTIDEIDMSTLLFNWSK